MTEKRTLILQTAKKLFIEQGIKGTTIAQIAEQAGIAKGSVYSYFRSKTEIVKAIVVQSFERAQQKAEAQLQDPQLQGPALLEAYIIELLREVDEERAFQQMWMADDSLVINDDLLTVIQSCRAEMARIQLALLEKALGQQSVPWRHDLLTLVNGLIQEFSVLIAMDNMVFSHTDCARFISRSAYCTLQGLLQDQPAPVLTEQTYVIEGLPGDKDSQIQRLLKLLKMKSATLTRQDQELVCQTIELIDQHWQQPANTTLLRALIANLRPYNELAEERAKLAELLEVELI